MSGPTLLGYIFIFSRFVKSKNVIIGAGPGGMAAAACLKEKGEDFIILEQHNDVAHAWRQHYDRLHLHTPKGPSALPGLKFPNHVPAYPSRQQVVNYMDAYCSKFDLKPKFNSKVISIEKIGDNWTVQTEKDQLEATNVIIATGNTNLPKRVEKPGIQSFTGSIIHSAEYKNGRPYRHKKVLVIGFGNSACEIALCLHEHGAIPSMSVRNGVNIVPRDIFGIPALGIGRFTDFIPPRTADKMVAPFLKWLIGDVSKFGLKKLPYGPKEQIIKYRRIPLLDIGTVKLLKEGKLTAYGDIQQIDGANITFEGGKTESFDAIVMATGYSTGLERFIELNTDRLEDMRHPIMKRSLFGQDNLFFIGFNVSPNGMLREMGIEARFIAEKISE